MKYNVIYLNYLIDFFLDNEDFEYEVEWEGYAYTTWEPY